MPDAPPEPASPSAGVVIRAARVSDFEGLAMIGAMPGFRSGTLRLPYRSPEETRHVLEGQGANDLALVAERDGAILGSAGWRRFEGRRAHIAAIGMGVHDAHVGRGIGTALLAALVDSADNWFAIRRLELTVYTDNATAIRLYRRFGFETEGTLRDCAFTAGRFVDALAMARIRVPG